MLNLIVKGNAEEAAHAAAERGITMTITRVLKHEVTAQCGPEYEENVTRWFMEDLGRQAPYPIGALLHWWPAHEGMVDDLADGSHANG